MDKITEAIDFLNIIKVTDKIWFRWIKAKEKLMNAREDFKELEEKCERLEKENKQAMKFLRDALPEIECVNHFQNGLITAIGTFLEALKENDDE